MFREGWMCRAGEQRWLSPPQPSWTGFLAPPVAPAVMTSREWLKWRVWWRNTWLLIAGTCELITFLMLLIPEINVNLSCCFYLFIYWLIYHFLNREEVWEQDCSETGRRHHCLPPVSPYRCRRQAVLDLLFDDVWRQLVGWMKELVQRHWECCTSSRAEYNYLACIWPDFY